MFRQDGHFNLAGVPAGRANFAFTLAAISDSQLTYGTATRFDSDIAAIQQARLEAIAQAQHSIQFETFKMSPGRRAKDFSTALQERAQQGVKIQLLADSYGAESLPREYWTSLENAGVEIRFFNPFSWRSPVDFLRRNHRKLLIIDQATALIGGAGISDFWDGEEPATTNNPWFDFEVHWQGEAVGWLTGLFWQHWLDAGGKVDLAAHQPRGSTEEPCSQILVTAGEDPTPQNSPIRSLFQASILAAKARIWMASPYLLPDQMTCTMLSQARQRGVDVRVLTMGPHNDKPYVYYTSRQHFGPLLKSGVKLHEYQPSMMHAKVILIDNDWVSLGSANLDPRSFFHNDELNLGTDHAALIQSVEAFFDQGFAQSQLIQLKDWENRPWQQKVLGKLFSLGYWHF
ncbi:MAG: phosphatidylserine/phosphatidylglycerophosphate/cardiolipin synthase family protein [Nodosilinea sp.]